MASSDYPAKLPLSCATNQTFSKTFTWVVNGSPVNLTGAYASMDLKWNGNETATLSLTSSNGRITLGGVAGTIAVNIPYATMATLTAGLYDYDLVVLIGGTKTPLVKDVFTVVEGVTQS